MNTRSIIELNRRFWLVEDAGHSGKGPADVRRDQREAIESFLSGRPLLPGVAWDELLRLRRVVILAEAGTGKTEEFKLRTRTLLNEGQCAFFCRMESIAEGRDFRGALLLEEEEEDEARFEKWLSGDAVGHFFIDSVDEAKLRVPSVDAALCSLVRALGDAKGRAHVYLSSRASEWDAGRDFAGFRDRFRDRLGGLPRIAFLLPLNFEQQGLFVEKLGLPGGKAMLESARRLGDYLVNRPLDLRSTSEYWGKHGRIDSHMKMVEHSVSKNLAEWEPERAKRRPLGLDKARLGAENLAATLTLCGESRIRIPSTEFVRKDEVDASEALPDWGAGEIAALLERPIFDPEIYGAVRFHHREAREYLAASWFKRMLDSGASPLRVLPAFQTTTYDETFVRPAMRPVAAWLAQMERGTREFSRRMLELEPVALMSHGDSSELPLPIRRDTLRAYAGKISDDSEIGIIGDAQLARFASAGMADTINKLLDAYDSSRHVLELLLRIVAAGKIAGCAKKALAIALDESKPKSVRHYAIFAVAVVDNEQSRKLAKVTVRRAEKWMGRTLVNAMRHLFPEAMSVRQFLDCLEKAAGKWRRSLFRAGDLVEGIRFECVDNDKKRELLGGILEVAGKRPIEWRRDPVLARLVARVLVPLMGDSDAPHEDEKILSAIEALGAYSGMGLSEKADIRKNITANWRLVHTLFWRAFRRKQRPVGLASDMWELTVHPELLREFLSDIRKSQDAKEREAAFYAVWGIWQAHGREAPGILDKIRGAFSLDEDMARKLDQCIQSVAENRREQERREKSRTREEKKRTRKDKRALQQSVDFLQKMSTRLCSFDTDVPPDVSRALQWLLQWIQDNDNVRSAENRQPHCWERMVPVFGREVADCARRGMVKFWRTQIPPLPSDEQWGICGDTLVGIYGLDILSRMQLNWADNLTAGEAFRAVRHAMRCHGKFPEWFYALFRAHPNAVDAAVRPEMEKNIREGIVNGSGVLNIMPSSDDLVGGHFARMALDILEANPQMHSMSRHYVGPLLRLLGDGEGREMVVGCYKRRVSCSESDEERAFWLAEWLRVDACNAIEELEARVCGASRRESAKGVMVALCAGLAREAEGHGAQNLDPDKIEFLNGIGNFRRVLRLVLMHVGHEDDEDDSGGYNRARIFRDDLVRLLASKFPGNEACHAMLELAEDPDLKDVRIRGFLRGLARKRAEDDASANFRAWTPARVIGFAKKRTPPFGDPDMFFQHVRSVLDEFQKNLETGDFSNAPLLMLGKEREAQLWFADRLREQGGGAFIVDREGEVVDGNKPDIRLHSSVKGGGVVSIEMKIVDKEQGNLSQLQGALKQLLQYLRDPKARHGVLLVIYKGGKRRGWKIPGNNSANFAELKRALDAHAQEMARESEGVDDIRVIGVDLS